MELFKSEEFMFKTDNFKTQQAWIKYQLTTKGYVTRNQCLRRYISRLSAQIFELKRKGMDIKSKRDGTDYRYYMENHNG